VSETLFPIIQPLANSESSSDTTELYKEVQWDYENNMPVFKSGSPVIITGRNAVLVWAWKALHVPRFRYVIYTWDYGNEVESLIGQPFTEDLKRSEAARYVQECLLINPYITGVNNITVNFNDGIMLVSCSLSTVYGEVDVSV